MPTALKILLFATAACLILTGFAFYPERPPTRQAEARHQPSAVQLWTTKSMAELEKTVAAGVDAERRVAEYEACARGVREDYSDDPARGYGWVRTLCRY